MKKNYILASSGSSMGSSGSTFLTIRGQGFETSSCFNREKVEERKKSLEPKIYNLLHFFINRWCI
jgi:hypothetical protein